jgi:hypothetical protein
MAMVMVVDVVVGIVPQMVEVVVMDHHQSPSQNVICLKMSLVTYKGHNMILSDILIFEYSMLWLLHRNALTYWGGSIPLPTGVQFPTFPSLFNRSMGTHFLVVPEY